MQIKRKVKRLTDVFLEVGDGDEDTVVMVFSNFSNQRVVKPFVVNDGKSAVQRFGRNCQLTLLAVKESCDKGVKGVTNLLRQGLIAAGAHGPISTEQVGRLNVMSSD